MSSQNSTQAERDAKLLRKLTAYLKSEELSQHLDATDAMRPWRAWYEQTFPIEATSAGGGKMVWRFPVTREYLNQLGILSGGAQATFHDLLTGWTLLIISRPDFWGKLGASRTLNMSYLAVARVGDILRLETQIIKVGLHSAMVRGVLLKESDGTIVSTCEHHLQNVDGGASKL